MIQSAKHLLAPKAKAGFSLVEVSFVMLLVGVVITPIILNQNAQNATTNQQMQSLENTTLNDTDVIELLQNPGRKKTLIKDITENMAEVALGANIIDKNLDSQDEFYVASNYLDNMAFFFTNTGTPTEPVYKYKLPTVSGKMMSTDQKTFFLRTSNGKYVPLFSYQWEFWDQSSNSNDENQNTSEGTYLVRGELKVFETSAMAQTKLTTVLSSTQIDSITTNFNLRNTKKVEDIKKKIPRVLINFTFDMSRGACYSPATSQYSRRLTYNTTSWATLPYISYDSNQGLLCAPYFQPSNNSPGSPWDSGKVESTTGNGTYQPDYYDIYYNDGTGWNDAADGDDRQLFWTNGKPQSDKEELWGASATAMGFAEFYKTATAIWYQATEGDGFSSLPSSGGYKIQRPRLNTNPTMNFDDGDFDKTALNYIRCYNHNNTKGSYSAKIKYNTVRTGGSPSTINLGATLRPWASDVFGPNSLPEASRPTSLFYPQEQCAQYNSTWKTPANNFKTPPVLGAWQGDYTGTVAPLPANLFEVNAAFSRFWIRQNGGDFGGEVFVTVEAARMAISDKVGPVGNIVANFKPGIFAAQSIEPVWSDNGDNGDLSPEEQRWISGVEFQRSAALISMFELLTQDTSYKKMFEVSLMLNTPLDPTTTNSTTLTPTTFQKYPDSSTPSYTPSLEDMLSKAKLSDTSQSQFKEVMKHLYGMNRLLGDFQRPTSSTTWTGVTNPTGDKNYRHLANYDYFNVKQSISDFRQMLKDTAQTQCRKDLGILLTDTSDGRCNDNDSSEWRKHKGYDHYVNIIFFPSDMSGNSTRTDPPKNNSTGNINDTTWSNSWASPGYLENDLKKMIPDDIIGEFAPNADAFKGHITYVLVVHKDMHSRLKERVTWLKNEMQAKSVPYLYKEVNSVKDYENFFNSNLLGRFDDASKNGHSGSDDFSNMKPDNYEY